MLPGSPTSSTLAAVMGLLVLACALGTTLALVRARRCQRAVSVDALTGLSNRSGLAARLLEWPIDRAAAFVLVDIDNFSELNEAFGPSVGDRVLVALASRLQTLARGGPTARWGSDEFALVVADVTGREAMGELAESISRALQDPIPVGTVEISLAAHVAVGGWPFQASDWDELQGKVDVALRRGKASWKRTVVYDPRPDAASVQRLALVGELRRAIDGDELRLRYQPRIRLADGAVVGAEALVRWQHPKRGLLGPGAFIPAAESGGLIGALTRRILAIAVADAAAWQADGWALSVSVNLSPQDLGDVGLATYVEDLLDTHGLAPELLTLEVTESAFMADASFGAQLLEDLSRRGVTVAIDDFGTGYSSLARVATMPARELKIDQGFVADIWSAGSAAVIQATIDLAHNLNMIVVAEGVETAEQYSQLVEYGCDDAQGFWLGKPMALAQFMAEAKRWDNDNRSVKAKVRDTDPPVDHILDTMLPTVGELAPERQPAPAATWLRRIVAAPGHIAAAAAAAYTAIALGWAYTIGRGDTLPALPLAAAAAAGCVWAGARHTARARTSWHLLAAASVVFGVGVLAPAVTVIACGLAAAGALGFPGRDHRERRDRFQLLLDCAAVTVAAGAAIWLMDSRLHDSGPLDVAAAVSALADLALLGALVYATLRGVNELHDRALRWVCIGLGVAVATDATGMLVAGGAVAGMAMVALGALVSRRQEGADAHASHGAETTVVSLPHVASAVVAILLLAALATSDVAWFPLGGLVIAAALVSGLVATRQMLSAKERMSMTGRFSVLARTDPLTGLANRRQVMDEGERLFERCGRDGASIAALVVDVDHFKLLNERHGHAVGDTVLQQVALLCTDKARTGDLIGRYGGDEIVLLLAGVDAAVAEAMAHRFNQLAADYTPEGLDYTLTVSIGVADSASAASLSALIRNADRALHEAKKAGRNQTAVFHAPLFAAS